MTEWKLHMLNARLQLTGHHEVISKICNDVEQRLKHVEASPPLDIVVRAADEPQPPEFAVNGSSFGPGRMELVIDCARDDLDRALPDALEKTILHELAHVLRWDGPGYGHTLGEALVSEGLAQHFVHHFMDCPSEPWEIALHEKALRAQAKRALQDFDSKDYWHGEWFFGSGELPNWTGYALGNRIVGDHLMSRPAATALSLAMEPASSFRANLADLAE
jgi:Predicted Zn-dependent protease (DUF2268)